MQTDRPIASAQQVQKALEWVQASVRFFLHDVGQPLSSIEAISYYLEMAPPVEPQQLKEYMQMVMRLIEEVEKYMDMLAGFDGQREMHNLVHALPDRTMSLLKTTFPAVKIDVDITSSSSLALVFPQHVLDFIVSELVKNAY